MCVSKVWLNKSWADVQIMFRDHHYLLFHPVIFLSFSFDRDDGGGGMIWDDNEGSRGAKSKRILMIRWWKSFNDSAHRPEVLKEYELTWTTKVNSELVHLHTPDEDDHNEIMPREKRKSLPDSKGRKSSCLFHWRFLPCLASMTSVLSIFGGWGPQRELDLLLVSSSFCCFLLFNCEGIMMICTFSGLSLKFVMSPCRQSDRQRGTWQPVDPLVKQHAEHASFTFGSSWVDVVFVTCRETKC